MKRSGRYICDACRHEIDPREVYSVTVARLDYAGWYEVLEERHYCEKCRRKIEITTTEQEGF